MIDPDRHDDAHAEPLAKVLHGGGPIIPGHPDYPMEHTECEHCRARTMVGSTKVHFDGCPFHGRDE
jgi:hypothetical protein